MHLGDLGSNNGVELIIDTESFDYANIDCDGDVGYKISINHPLDMPVLEQTGISLAPGTSNQLGVSVKIMTVDPAVLTRDTDPVTRNCYLNQDVSFKYLPYEEDYHYSMSNCLFEASMQSAEEKCGCVARTFQNGDRDQSSCSPQKLYCFQNVLDLIGQHS